MNEQPVSNQPVDRREARRQRREGTGGWIVGVILIVLGGLFLLQNSGALRIPLTSWWALFILIPALGAFERAWRVYRSTGNQFTNQVSGSILLGIVLTLVTAAFLFNFGWTYFGPPLIILAGLGILLNGMISRHE